MDNIAIKIENVSKEYRLGAIGGGTLKGDLQTLWANIRHKEDPNTKIGDAEKGKKGDRFMALDGVSFEVKKGEALGIIGHNGAGKSTLLKLLSRVTAPSGGKISFNGRIASMLEVGTGFHPELTGRENVYMNGAILGMTKTEIDNKFDEIVKFAEMEKFIDTPVKRYSSGMYVKLAFAVAAHLDSEILIMDEVLAVGDMKFQQKCLGKMSNAANIEGRTVLYVSHNMNTIRQLCDRCIVLDHGTVVFDGDTEDAIEIYLGKKTTISIFNDCSKTTREPIGDASIHINSVELLNVDYPILKNNEHLQIKVDFFSKFDYSNLSFRLILFSKSRIPIGMTTTNSPIHAIKGENTISFDLNFPNLAQEEFNCRIVFYETDNFGGSVIHDVVDNAFSFIKEKTDNNYGTNLNWNTSVWGNCEFPNIDVIKI